jgi:hypothetical protein
MKAYEINTTAWNEENFVLFTDLTEGQITDVITPIVMAERGYGEEYTNDDLIDALLNAYPNNQIYGYQNNPKRIEI